MPLHWDRTEVPWMSVGNLRWKSFYTLQVYTELNIKSIKTWRFNRDHIQWHVLGLSTMLQLCPKTKVSETVPDPIIRIDMLSNQ
jgi:hypothetical protein